MPGGSSDRRGGAGWRQETAAIAAEAAAEEAVAVTVTAETAAEETVADTIEVTAANPVQVVRSGILPSADTCAATSMRLVPPPDLLQVHSPRRRSAARANVRCVCVRWSTGGSIREADATPLGRARGGRRAAARAEGLASK